MSLDLLDLQRVIFRLESDIERLREDVAQLRHLADSAVLESPDALNLARASLTLPPEVVVRRPDEVGGYLHVHSDLKDLVSEMAAALVDEFRGERSEVELAVYQDPEIEARELIFNVRLPEYGDSLLPRLDAVSRQFDDRFIQASGSVCITTDYGLIESSTLA